MSELTLFIHRTNCQISFLPDSMGFLKCGWRPDSTALYCHRLPNDIIKTNPLSMILRAIVFDRTNMSLQFMGIHGEVIWQFQQALERHSMDSCEGNSKLFGRLGMISLSSLMSNSIFNIEGRVFLIIL